jgi:phospholipid/cholesterol/gamma-HCH transport system substrate-binding protein
MNRTLTPFKVGIMVLLGAGAGLVLLAFIGNRGFSAKDTYHVYALFSDASGLGEKSRVQIAGIEVGVVEKIVLTEDARALVTLRIRKSVVLHQDARVTKRSASLLGDFLLDIYPGSASSPVLHDGDTISKAVGQPGMEDVFASLGEVTHDIQGITHSIKELLSNDEVGSIKNIITSMNKVADGLNKTIAKAGGQLNGILGDAKYLTEAIRSLADNQGGNVQNILGNLKTFTEGANRVVNALDQIVGSNQEGLKQSVASIKENLDELEKTLKGAQGAVGSVTSTVNDAHAIITGVAEGKGTLGKLVTDDSIANNLNGTLGALGSILKPVANLSLDARLYGEVHYRPGLPGEYNRPWVKGGVALKLITDPTFYYGVDVISDPRGYSTKQVASLSNPNSTAAPVVTQSIVTNDDLKVSAYVSKRLGPVAFRAGVIESSGGVGMDAFVARDHVRFTVDAFDFGDPYATYPRLRAQAQVSFLGHLFISAGVDDILNIKPVLQAGRFLVGTDGFVGGGVSLTDDDVTQMLKAAGGK